MEKIKTRPLVTNVVVWVDLHLAEGELVAMLIIIKAWLLMRSWGSHVFAIIAPPTFNLCRGVETLGGCAGCFKPHRKLFDFSIITFNLAYIRID